MTKTIEAVALAYKKENSSNKKVKIPAIRHLLENKKTITEVSEILFKAYNTIKNWRVHWRMIISLSRAFASVSLLRNALSLSMPCLGESLSILSFLLFEEGKPMFDLKS